MIDPVMRREIESIVQDTIAKLMPQNQIIDIEEGHSHWRQFGHFILPLKTTETFAATTTLTNIDDFKWDIRKREAFTFMGMILAGGPTAGDIDLAVTVPSGAALTFWGFGPELAISASEAAGRWRATATSGNRLDFGVFNGSALLPILIGGRVANGDTGGEANLQRSQRVSDAGTTRILAGSYLWVHREESLNL